MGMPHDPVGFLRLTTTQPKGKVNQMRYQIHWPNHKIETVESLVSAYDKLKPRNPHMGNYDTFKHVIESKGHFVSVYGFSETWVFLKGN